MKKNARIFVIYAVVFAVIAVVGVGLRCFALAKSYDIDIGYYQTGALLPDVFHGLCITAVALAVVLALLLPKKAEYAPLPGGSTVTAVGSAFALSGCGAQTFYSLLLLSKKSEPSMGSVQTGQMGDALIIFSLIFGFLSVVYFALVMAGKAKNGDKHVIFGYGIILFVLMTLAKTYFDLQTTMNSPNKLLLQVTFMAIMVYMLYELRFSLGISQPRGYMGAAFAAFYLTAVNSLPGIIMFFAGSLNKTDYLVCDFMTLGFAIYIGTRIFDFSKAQLKK